MYIKRRHQHDALCRCVPSEQFDRHFRGTVTPDVEFCTIALRSTPMAEDMTVALRAPQDLQVNVARARIAVPARDDSVLMLETFDA